MAAFDVQQLLDLLFQADTIHNWHVAGAVTFTCVASKFAKSVRRFAQIAFLICIWVLYVSLSMYVMKLGEYYVFIYNNISWPPGENPFYRSGFTKSWLILGVSTSYISALTFYYMWRERSRRKSPAQTP